MTENIEQSKYQTAYLLCHGDYSDKDVLAVFLDKSTADAWAEYVKEDRGWDCYIDTTIYVSSHTEGETVKTYRMGFEVFHLSRASQRYKDKEWGPVEHVNPVVLEEDPPQPVRVYKSVAARALGRNTPMGITVHVVGTSKDLVIAKCAELKKELGWKGEGFNAEGRL